MTTFACHHGTLCGNTGPHEITTCNLCLKETAAAVTPELIAANMESMRNLEKEKLT
jgi:hypothetical protein